MQTTTARFDELATSSIRKIDWRCLISFEKTYNASVAFFTIGTSAIGGSDFIKPADANVVQEWDKYDFEDYSDQGNGNPFRPQRNLMGKHSAI